MSDDKTMRMNEAIVHTSAVMGMAFGKMEAELITLQIVLKNLAEGLGPRERISPEKMKGALEIAKRIQEHGQAASSHFCEVCELIAERDEGAGR